MARYLAALSFHRPPTLDEALALRAAHPDATVLAGGTEVMAQRNRDPASPSGTLLDLSAVRELRGAQEDDGVLRLGALTSFTALLEDHAAALPGLAAAARTVAGRQIRNRATVGGAVALADPSADVLAALVAADAHAVISRTPSSPSPGREGRLSRDVAVAELVTGAWETALAPDELIVAVNVPVATGGTAYAKVGARNALARAACGVAVALRPRERRGAICVAACGPTPLRSPAAEALLADGPWDGAPGDAWLRAVGDAVAGDVTPRGDHRGSAEYKHHVAGVLTRRAVRRAWETAA